MKRDLLIIIVAFIFYVHSENQIEVISKCIETTGINETLVHEIGINLVVPAEELTKTFIECFNQYMGFQNEEGVMNFEKIREYLIGLTEVEVHSVINTCKHVKGTNKIESSYLVTKCLLRKIKAIIKV